MDANIVLLIPANNPTLKIIPILNSIIESLSNQIQIVMVNDHTDIEFMPVIEIVGALESTKVITSDKSKGKGNAIKFGIEYILQEYPKANHIVTADADGQHSTTDILNIINQVNSNSFVIGVRSFPAKVTPLKSYLGNQVSRTVLSLLARKKIVDSQSGLRGFSIEIAKQFLHIPDPGFAFETEALLWVLQNTKNMAQIPIQTIYFDKNQGTHFHPIKDTYKISKIAVAYLRRLIKNKGNATKTKK